VCNVEDLLLYLPPLCCIMFKYSHYLWLYCYTLSDEIHIGLKLSYAILDFSMCCKLNLSGNKKLNHSFCCSNCISVTMQLLQHERMQYFCCLSLVSCRFLSFETYICLLQNGQALSMPPIPFMPFTLPFLISFVGM
jgi:hypothetical protein